MVSGILPTNGTLGGRQVRGGLTLIGTTRPFTPFVPSDTTHSNRRYLAQLPSERNRATFLFTSLKMKLVNTEDRFSLFKSKIFHSLGSLYIGQTSCKHTPVIEVHQVPFTRDSRKISLEVAVCEENITKIRQVITDTLMYN